jgi:hypothetical protein
MRTILVLGLLSTMGLPQPPGEGNWQAQEAAYLKNIKQLTFDYARAGEAYFSPDGKLIIFQAEEKGENPFYQIFVQDLQTGRGTNDLRVLPARRPADHLRKRPHQPALQGRSRRRIAQARRRSNQRPATALRMGV